MRVRRLATTSRRCQRPAIKWCQRRAPLPLAGASCTPLTSCTIYRSTGCIVAANATRWLSRTHAILPRPAWESRGSGERTASR
eukprot:5331626-Pyramimonas_sp.AAC.1